MNLHRTLERQLRKHFGGLDNIPHDLEPLFQVISDTYGNYEEDLNLIDNAINISSDELRIALKKSQEHAFELEQILEKVKNAILDLRSLTSPGEPQEIIEEGLVLADILRKESRKIRELQEELWFVYQMVDWVTDPILISDESGEFAFVNTEASKKLGYSKEELLSLSAKEMDEMFQGNGAWERWLERLKNMDHEIVEGATIKHDGTTFPVEVNARYRQLNNKGYVIAILRDISERKKNQEKLEKVNKELKEFAHLVSHDLKAPLRGVSTIASWLKEDYTTVLDPSGIHHLDLLMDRVERMENLINDILEFSTLQGDTLSESVDLDQLTNEVLTAINIPAHIELRRSYQLPTIERVDKTRMFQLLQNLVSNAVKYNDKPNGWLEIGGCENAKEWQLWVKDNGIGIHESYHTKIFEIFQTIQPKNAQSTGIGLAIVKKIVDYYNGNIKLVSSPGNGAQFIISLPKTVQHVQKSDFSTRRRRN